jgi:hypothetical protein
MDGMAVEVELVLFATTKRKKKIFFRSLAKKFLDCFNPVKLHLAPRFYNMSKLFITLCTSSMQKPARNWPRFMYYRVTRATEQLEN